MPITAFNSFTDGLAPNQRNREHFITNTNLDDDRLWVPYANGVWFQPCYFNVTSGGFSLVLKGLPGSMVGTHITLGPCMATRCAVTGGTWSTIGSQNLAPTSTSRPAKRTH
jgi:hypothetical protein